MDEFWWDVVWSTGTTACGVESLLFNVEGEGDAICLKLRKDSTIEATVFSGKIKKFVEAHFETFFNFAIMRRPFVCCLFMRFSENTFCNLNMIIT